MYVHVDKMVPVSPGRLPAGLQRRLRRARIDAGFLLRLSRVGCHPCTAVFLVLEPKMTDRHRKDVLHEYFELLNLLFKYSTIFLWFGLLSSASLRQ